jgi:hypothetical protein
MGSRLFTVDIIVITSPPAISFIEIGKAGKKQGCGFLRSRDDESTIPLPVQRFFFKLDRHLPALFVAMRERALE